MVARAPPAACASEPWWSRSSVSSGNGAVQGHLAAHVGANDDALLFAAQHGGHLAKSTLSRHFYAARLLAGRPDLRFHDLRHTGAVLAAATGASLAELMGRLGHGTPQAALRYQHVVQDRDQAIAELLSRLAQGGVAHGRRDRQGATPVG